MTRLSDGVLAAGGVPAEVVRVATDPVAIAVVAVVLGTLVGLAINAVVARLGQPAVRGIDGERIRVGKLGR